MRARSWIEVSRSAIAANYDAVKRLVGPAVEVAPVVKADAYGHGALAVSRIAESRGARWLCVSNVAEGIALRESGSGARILVMADSLEASFRPMIDYRLTPVLHDLAEIRALDALGTPIGYHLKIDSGMGRLGTIASAPQIAQAVQSANYARLEGLMTHFASAADYVSSQTAEQSAEFERLCEELARLGVRPPMRHMSSTIAVAYGRREAWHSMVRPGHAIYGYVSPVRAKGAEPVPLLEVQPALGWKTRLLVVKDLPAGARIGYGAQFTTPKPMRIGVLAAGYADGIPHRLSNRGRVIAGGRFAPILGAVSMDVTTIDLTNAPQLRPGDPVTLLGRDGESSQDAREMARAAGTISYSLLCGISARVERVYAD